MSIFPRVAARQPREFVEVLVIQLSPVCHMQLRSEDMAFLVCLGYFSAGLDFVLLVVCRGRGGRSVRCVCSKVTFLCEVVCSTTGLTGWVDRSRYSAFLIIYFVCIRIVGNFILGVRVCLTTIVVITVATIRVFFGFGLSPV